MAYHVKNRLEAIRGYTKAKECGLPEADQARVDERREKLKDGEFMIQVLPGAAKKDPSGSD